MTALHDGEYPELLSTSVWERVAERKRLSDRELEVLRLLCRGMRNDAIAVSLGIQLPTLRTHLRSIYQKLECTGRTQALLCVIHETDRAHPLR